MTAFRRSLGFASDPSPVWPLGSGPGCCLHFVCRIVQLRRLNPVRNAFLPLTHSAVSLAELVFILNSIRASGLGNAFTNKVACWPMSHLMYLIIPSKSWIPFIPDNNLWFGATGLSRALAFAFICHSRPFPSPSPAS